MSSCSVEWLHFFMSFKFHNWKCKTRIHYISMNGWEFSQKCTEMRQMKTEYWWDYFARYYNSIDWRVNVLNCFSRNKQFIFTTRLNSIISSVSWNNLAKISLLRKILFIACASEDFPRNTLQISRISSIGWHSETLHKVRFVSLCESTRKYSLIRISKSMPTRRARMYANRVVIVLQRLPFFAFT